MKHDTTRNTTHNTFWREIVLSDDVRINAVLRGAPAPKAPGKRGPNPKHGVFLHPGKAEPETPPDEDLTLIAREIAKPEEEERTIRLRRWSAFHFEEQAATILDVVRVDDPKYDKPLLIGGTARELSTGFARARVGARGATTRKRFGQSRHQSSRRPA
jgi:hypothetical protein